MREDIHAHVRGWRGKKTMHRTYYDNKFLSIPPTPNFFSHLMCRDRVGAQGAVHDLSADQGCDTARVMPTVGQGIS